MSTKKIVEFVAGIVEPDKAARVALIDEVSRKREAGQDVAETEDGFDWKAWAIDFAGENPVLTLFAPVALGLYVFLIISLFL